MTRIVSCSASRFVELDDGWECAVTPAGAFSTPDDLTGSINWIAAPVPGTAAAALRAAGVWDGVTPLELDGLDVWYRVRFAGGHQETLCFEGLATIADVWLNGAHLFRSENMFVPREAAVTTRAANEMHICFRALTN